MQMNQWAAICCSFFLFIQERKAYMQVKTNTKIRHTMQCALNLTANARNGIEKFFKSEQALFSSEKSFHVFIEKKPENRQGNLSFSLYFHNEENENLSLLLDARVAVMECVIKNDGFLATGFHVRGKREPVVTNRRYGVNLKFILNRQTAAQMPLELYTALRELPIAEDRSEYVKKRIASWEGYLRIQEMNADVEDIQTTYANPSLSEDFSKVQLICKELSGKILRTLQGFSANITGLSGDIGNVSQVKPNQKMIEIELSPYYKKRARHHDFNLFAFREVTFSNFAELSQVRRLRKGFKDLTDGLAANANLEKVLFEERPVVRISNEKKELAFHNRLNEFQREAVTGAMTAHDLYVIQGPPGTGKTTVISEICYQNAKAGLKTLVASQANLAVDNALGRLLDDQDIRILRYGRTESIEEEGKKFIEENVADYWKEQTIQALEAKLQAYDETTIQLKKTLENTEERLVNLQQSFQFIETKIIEKEKAEASHEALVREQNTLNGEKDTCAAQIKKCENELATLMKSEQEAQEEISQLKAQEEKVQLRAKQLESEGKLQQLEAFLEESLVLLKLEDFQAAVQQFDIDIPNTAIEKMDQLQKLIVKIKEGLSKNTYDVWQRLEQRLDKAIPLLEKTLQQQGFLQQANRTGLFGQQHSPEKVHAFLDRMGRVLIEPKTKELLSTRNYSVEKYELLEKLAAAYTFLKVQKGYAKMQYGEIEQQKAMIEQSKILFKTIKKETIESVNNQLNQFMKKIESNEAELAKKEEMVVKLTETIQDLKGAQTKQCEFMVRIEESLLQNDQKRTALLEVLASKPEEEKMRLTQKIDAYHSEIEEIKLQQTGLPLKKQLQEEWLEMLKNATEYDLDEIRKLYIAHANVIGTTCVASARRDFMEEYPTFDVVIIDEVSKATPPELLLPMLKGKKIILVGDHHQLPPLMGQETLEEFLEESANQEEKRELEQLLKESLFERLFRTLPKQNKTMLAIQYRMHEKIMQTITPFYEEGDYALTCGLENSDEVRDHLLETDLFERHKHLYWYDIPNEKPFFEAQVKGGTSRYNEAELTMIKNMLVDLNDATAKAIQEGKMDIGTKKNVGVISFYGEQVKRIDRLLTQELNLPHLHCRTGSVDKFQGMEMDVILLSFVRNHDQPGGDIGFAKDYRRLNVALSRARELLAIIGSTEMFTKRPRNKQTRQMFERLLDNVKAQDGLKQVLTEVN